MSVYKLSPSDFTFLWEECKRCFYLKVKNGFPRPFPPFPKMFIKIDGLQKKYFSGKASNFISAKLPSGKITLGEKWVESKPIKFPDMDSSCFIKGKFDSILEFDDKSFGIIDFKTSDPKSEHTPLYSRQLHAYAQALENPAEGKLKLSPISRLGLVCIDHQQMDYDNKSQQVYYKCNKTWIEIQRNDKEFLDFLKEIVILLDKEELPDSDPKCPWCEYRDKTKRTAN